MFDLVLDKPGSLTSRIDPRVRIASALAFAAVTALCSDFRVLGAAMALSLACSLLARLRPALAFRRLLVINGFFLFLWIFVPFSEKGQAVFQLGPLAASREGLLLCAQMTLKGNAIFLSFLALVAPMPMATLGQALGGLGLPDAAVSLLLLTYRYVSVIEKEFSQLLRAARMRAFIPGTSAHAYRTYAYLLGMVLVRASERGKRVHNAMVLRGFTGRFRGLEEFSLGRADVLFLALALLATAALGAMQWTHILP